MEPLIRSISLRRRIGSGETGSFAFDSAPTMGPLGNEYRSTVH